MGKWGKIVKSIGVFSNDPEKRTEILTFEASIKPIFRMTPSSIVTLTGKKGERKRAEVLIITSLDKPLKIEPEGFALDQGKMSYSLETVEAGKQYRVVFSNNPDISGIFNGELRLRTNYTEKPQIKIRVHARFN
jgi:hypothetical protein